MNTTIETAMSGLDSSFHQQTATIRKSISWSAIFAGLAVAMALQVLFMMLGAALGFAIYTPMSDTNPVANLGSGAAVIEGVSAVISLWFGGWVAGRFTNGAQRKSAWLHGFIVWSSATVVGVIFVASGATWVTGDLSQLVRGGLSAAGKPAAAAVSKAADIAKSGDARSTSATTSFVDEAIGRRTDNHSASDATRAKRDISMAVARLFDPSQQANRTANQAALVRVLVSDAGMNEADANNMTGEWLTSYDQLMGELKSAKDQLAAQARETAESAAHALSILSICGFIGFLMGALASSLGARHGAAHADNAEFRDEDLSAAPVGA